MEAEGSGRSGEEVGEKRMTYLLKNTRFRVAVCVGEDVCVSDCD